MRPSEAIAEIDRYGARLAERLLETIDPVHGGFRDAHSRAVDATAHLLLWRHYMVTGKPTFGDAVIGSLRAICRISPVHQMEGDARSGTTLGDNAQLLEVLTWVWRQCRCRELRVCAEGIATWAVERMSNLGIAARACGDDPLGRGSPAASGLMLVALVEAGSVFERRDWLALTRTVFDKIIAQRSEAAWLLDDYVMMSRAAIRLFEAFGKARYLELAEAWVATLDDAFRDIDGGVYRTNAAQRPGLGRITDAILPSAVALMIGILARLHALTGTSRYAERAERLVDACHRAITGAGVAAATAVANVQTLALLVTIRVSGDPKLSETRELMRIALDHALPDRLVLGPGAGDPADAIPKAQVRLGSRCLAPIADASRLSDLLAPGGLAKAS